MLEQKIHYYDLKNEQYLNDYFEYFELYETCPYE